jgi:nitrogen-specific signal transduction histidine kinase
MVSVDPMKNENSPELFVHIIRDITDIKIREKEILSARKAEAFSTLSGGIAHDYNNILSVIWGNISLLREDITDALHLELFDEVEKACEQAKSLTQKFITLSKGAILKKEPHSLQDILTEVIKEIGDTRGVKVLLEIPDPFPSVEVDPENLKIAFHNIIRNSLEAIPGQGQLKIRATRKSFAFEDQDRQSRVNIVFEDTGEGIVQSDLANIFDPYFTTKEMGTIKGAGLGLAVSKSIIKKHGGSIQVESGIGKGTRVRVSLPLPDLEIQDPDIQSGPNPLVSPDKPVILIMEDDSGLRRLCERILQRLNCEVITAGCSKEAVKKYSDAVGKQEEIDLVILDRNIRGGTGGVETLKKLRTNGYDKKAVIITSAVNRWAKLDPQKYESREHEFDGQLIKPYTKQDLEDLLGAFVPGFS